MSTAGWAVGGKTLHLFRAVKTNGVWVPKQADGTTNATSASHRFLEIELAVNVPWTPTEEGTFTSAIDQDQDDNDIIDLLETYAWLPVTAATSNNVSERRYRNNTTKGGTASTSVNEALIIIDYNASNEAGTEIKVVGAIATLARTSGATNSQADSPTSPQLEIRSIIAPSDTELFPLLDGAIVKKTGSGAATSFVQAENMGIKQRWLPVAA